MRKIIVLLTLAGCLSGAGLSARPGNPVLDNGLKFVGAPYVAHTLENNEREELYTDRSTVDCTTFVEYVLALSLTPEEGMFSEEEFARNLQRIRYRDGIIDGYPSRLHYVADWIGNNIRKGLIVDVTAAHSADKDTVRLFYMSKHPDKYRHLAGSPENVARMVEIEKELNGREVYWLPKHKLPEEGLEWIRDGDIVMLTTNIPGLDVSHMGIAMYREGKLHLLHASSVEKKVVIDKRTLRKQLDQSKSTTGIRVVRLTNER